MRLTRTERANARLGGTMGALALQGVLVLLWLYWAIGDLAMNGILSDVRAALVLVLMTAVATGFVVVCLLLLSKAMK